MFCGAWLHPGERSYRFNAISSGTAGRSTWLLRRVFPSVTETRVEGRSGRCAVRAVAGTLRAPRTDPPPAARQGQRRDRSLEAAAPIHSLIVKRSAVLRIGGDAPSPEPTSALAPRAVSTCDRSLLPLAHRPAIGRVRRVTKPHDARSQGGQHPFGSGVAHGHPQRRDRPARHRNLCCGAE